MASLFSWHQNHAKRYLIIVYLHLFFQAGSEVQTQAILEVRGPGNCGLILDILTANLKRTKPEIITILKKNG